MRSGITMPAVAGLVVGCGGGGDPSGVSAAGGGGVTGPVREERTVTRTVGELDRGSPCHGSTGVRKAVGLGECATLIRNRAATERSPDCEAPAPTEGVEHRSHGGWWEQSSVSLPVSVSAGDGTVRGAPVNR
ncbi:MAG: hypothetical protein V5A44_12665 [Haloarculaceae archaeon]